MNFFTEIIHLRNADTFKQVFQRSNREVLMSDVPRVGTFPQEQQQQLKFLLTKQKCSRH